MKELITSLLTPENMTAVAVVVGAIWGIWKFVKKFAGKGAVIPKEIGEAFLATSSALSAADKAIKEDGSLDENSIAEVIKAGKAAKLEWHDVILEVKPKKQTK